MKLEFYAVVTERDSDFRDHHFSEVGEDSRRPEGPLLFEMYPQKAGSLAQARDRVKSLGGKYGWAYVAKVIVDTQAPENAPWG